MQKDSYIANPLNAFFETQCRYHINRWMLIKDGYMCFAIKRLRSSCTQ